MSTARGIRRLDPLHVVDVFVYVTVLNLAAQWVPQVITESFTTSLFTAIVLKLVLEAVLWLKKAVLTRLKTASTWPRRVISIVVLVLLLPGSKLVVLELIHLIFGGAVALGGFFLVTALIIVLMLARRGVRWLLAPRGASAPITD
ncbi:hypothetical protein [uncultured Microbacterium sp.]|uniref:hypothetical protein n=1 Tax=uncultured Microbacterium sp. TaxID=191216 RepID=UPI002355077F|nr:hypothetical protein [uncultured Microbacterium sp.]